MSLSSCKYVKLLINVHGRADMASDIQQNIYTVTDKNIFCGIFILSNKMDTVHSITTPIIYATSPGIATGVTYKTDIVAKNTTPSIIADILLTTNGT